ncbi:MAG: hypothetical protein ACJ79S_03740 [Gemmatimonadaceae bacterium]
MRPHSDSHIRARSGRAAALVALGAALGAALLGACQDSTVPNYNDPSLPDVPQSSTDLVNQTRGILAGDREQHAFQILVLETMGRDAYRIDVADSRYIQMPLGNFSPSAFLVDFTWNSLYRTIRAARILTEGIDKSKFSEQDKAATRGFARTFQAFEYLRLLESRDTLGVPIVVSTGKLDPVRCKPAALAYVSALLDSAAADLAQGGAAFPFTLTTGFTGFGTFDTPATFLQFNRGLAAKALTYRGFIDYARNGSKDAVRLDSALKALDASFEPGAGSLRDGVYHVFSTASGDLQNANFDNSVYRANPKVLSQAEPGDARLSKVRKDPSANIFLGEAGAPLVASDILFLNVSSPTSPLPILTREELRLVRAEVLWGLGREGEALAVANDIRRTYGLGSASASGVGLLREILKQKRYSLLWESGARLVDYRMFGLFDELGQELVGQPGPKVIPFPQAEIDARGGDLTCS